MFTVKQELAAGRPGEPRATLVAMHYMGGDAAEYAELLRPHLADLPPIRLVLLQADTPNEDDPGYTWFPPEYYTDPSTRQALLGEMADTVAARLKPYGPVLVTGTSQGGDLSLALAVRHPEQVLGALPLLGLLPDVFLPEPGEGAEVPPVHAFHGEEDPEVPVAQARRTAAALVERGVPLTLRTYPGVAHELPEQMLRDWRAALAELLDTLPDES